MTAIKTKSLSVMAAKLMMDEFADLSANSSLFITLGKTTPWDNEVAPPAPLDTVCNHIGVWNSMIFAKKLTGNDVSLVARRIDWSANTIYTAFDDCAEILSNTNANFYVVTSDYNVYKCIDNNNGGQSTVEPTYTNPFFTNKTIDNYVWKYLYTISRAQRLRFTTNDWIPVRDITTDDGSSQWDVQDAAVDGAINSIVIDDAGSNYTNQANVSVVISGDGASATATVSLNTISNTVNTITISNPGRGYSNASAVIVGGGGSGAILDAIISPFGGHGADVVEELGASTLMINARIKDSENDKLPVENDYRQIALLHNPTEFGTDNVANNFAYTQTLTLYLLGSGTPYINDEFVFQGFSLATSTFKGRVLRFDSGNNKLFLANTVGTISSDIITGADSTAGRFVSSYTDPGLNKYSGNMLYFDNIEPITRNSDQTEDIKIAISF